MLCKDIALGKQQQVVHGRQQTCLAFAPDHAGSPKVNSMIIRPMTKAQSGREGILHFASELFQIKEDKITDLFWSAFAQSFDLNFSDLTLENIDTLHHPITVGYELLSE